MTTEQRENVVETDRTPQERPRLVSVEVGGWPGLGGNVSFSVAERTTVLVGRNGAGKSLLVEAIHGAARAARTNMHFLSMTAPVFFRCETACSDGREYTYQYQLGAQPPRNDDAEDAPRFRPYSESCRLMGTDTDLWTIENGKLTRLQPFPSAVVRFAYGEGLVSAVLLSEELDFPIPREARELSSLFHGTHVVHAGVPRVIETPHIESYRREVLLVYESAPSSRHLWRPIAGPWNRLATLARDIVRMYEEDHEGFTNFHERLRRLGLVDDIEIAFSEEPKPTRARVAREPRTYAAVLFDGVNIGLCSDGTQRVSEIVLHLLRRDTTLLLVEEPEIAVHPSLLAKLLSLIEAHSLDKQVILSTHAPQIVDWCKPKDLRVVERVEGRTVVLELGDDDLARIHRYLSHEGTLSEYMYHRGDA